MGCESSINISAMVDRCRPVRRHRLGRSSRDHERVDSSRQAYARATRSAGPLTFPGAWRRETRHAGALVRPKLLRRENASPRTPRCDSHESMRARARLNCQLRDSINNARIPPTPARDPRSIKRPRKALAGAAFIEAPAAKRSAGFARNYPERERERGR